MNKIARTAAAFVVAAGLSLGVAPTSADAATRPTTGTKASNEGRNQPDSRTLLYAYKGGVKYRVPAGKYLPNNTKEISTPNGYKATAWFPGRGQWCIDNDKHKIPAINRTWKVSRGSCNN